MWFATKRAEAGGVDDARQLAARAEGGRRLGSGPMAHETHEPQTPQTLRTHRLTRKTFFWDT
jgi:hypothetical protein